MGICIEPTLCLAAAEAGGERRARGVEAREKERERVVRRGTEDADRDEENERKREI